MPWAIKWNGSDGEHFIAAAGIQKPDELSGYTKVLFSTREAARAYIRKRYGYITTRKDLQKPPHCWKMPQAVRVKVVLMEIEEEVEKPIRKREGDRTGIPTMA